MKKNTLLLLSFMLFGMISFGQTFFMLDSIRHPNCQNINGNAYFTLNFQPATSGILVKWGLMPGSEFANDFTVIANVTDNNMDGVEPFVYSATEGNNRLYFVYPDLLLKDSIDFHFNSHIINFVGGFAGLNSCDSISSSGVSFSGGTPPYKLFGTTNNWQTETFIGDYNSSNPANQIDVSLQLPIGHYQYKLQDSYCETLSPDQITIWSIGNPVPNTWITICPEILGDTISLNGSMNYSKQLTVISGPVASKWTDTLSVTVNFGDGTQSETFINRIENWENPFNISHTYSNSGIYQVQYSVENTRLSSDSWYIASVDEFVNAGTVLAPENAISEKQILVYPNPVKNNLNILIPSEHSEKAIIQIFNIAGQIVYSRELILKSGINSRSVYIESLNSGVYTVLVKTESVVFNQRFIK